MHVLNNASVHQLGDPSHKTVREAQVLCSWRSELRAPYHDEACGDGVVAAVTQLSKLGPVVLLAEETAILLIVPVGQGRTALTTPGTGRDAGTTIRYSSCNYSH